MAEQNSGQNKDELANLLGAMVDGEHVDDSEQVEEESPTAASMQETEPARPAEPAVSSPPRIGRPLTPDAPPAGSGRPATPVVAPVESAAISPQGSTPSAQPVRPVVRSAPPVARRPATGHISQRLFFKRTITPICLNVGVICFLLPVVGYLSASTSPLSRFGGWVGAGFLAISLVMFGVAAVTMTLVKHELAQEVSPPSPRPR